MTTYKAPLDDMRFALFDVLDGEAVLTGLEGGEEHSRELIDTVIDEFARFAEEVLAPVNASGDAEGCHFDKATRTVTTPKGFKEAYRRYAEDGWAGLTASIEAGGQGLPAAVGTLTKEMIDSANTAWGIYPLLSHGAIDAIAHHGDDWQKEVFLKRIVDGSWTGTMCLTEPQAGSDLGLLKTRAEPNGDGSYRVSGTKIFISAGEHDFAENIVHLVLARLPDAPAGSRGISMLVVPKFKVNKDGSLGERNSAAAGAIEHKMGIRGAATCVMNFDEAEGWLIGAPHKGLMAMFTMMNSARLGVGVQGLGLSEAALQGSLRYALDRLQMRALSGPRMPEKPADPIVVHPDVRRMLLTQRAFVEGGRVLAAYASLQSDIEARHPDAQTRQQAGELLSFLIPIAKGLLTESAQECTKEALQIFGGHGYIVEHGMEQLVRDARIITLYEGTTQIQALDLLGRKVMQLQGAGLKRFLDEIGTFCREHAGDDSLKALVGPVATAATAWGELTRGIAARAQANPEELGAAAMDYLYFSGYVTLAYFWARSVAALDRSRLSASARQAKRDTAAFYMARILPRIHLHKAGIDAGVATLPEIAGD
ncbi:acyl-CoA dehydrogenase C-terminal domain-containing protein [Luteibacter sp. PPL201]|uniref:Acyl-CoA dehydrogenase C-terminal domain-containing protein n=1 Tax=Luteibacter sahnii TaxID=3021977 RepID=A0ABT6B6I3_9GAMM